jgi:hypothetical protein
MEAILQEVGFITERFLAYDEQGEVFGEPDQIELDVVVKNGKVIIIAIKSSSIKRMSTILSAKLLSMRAKLDAKYFGG